MRSHLENLSVKRKLVLMCVVASGVALLVTSIGFLSYDLFAFKRQMVQNLTTTAHMVGYNSVSALAFDDAASAEQTLHGLAVQPHIAASAIFTRDGQLFAHYQRAGMLSRIPTHVEADGEKFASEQLEMFQAIEFKGERVGTVYLRSDLGELTARWQHYGVILLLVLAGGLLVAWMIAARVQRVISEPVSGLVSVARRVAADRDYGLRAVKRGNDELGELVDVFNDMLEQISLRNAELKAAHATLERRVEERTAALQQAKELAAREHARLRFIFDSAPVGIGLVEGGKSGDQGTRLLNGAHLRICGLTPEQAEDPDIFQCITHPEDYAQQLARFAEMEQGVIDRFSMEKRYLRPDGVTVWVVFSYLRLRYEDGSHEDLSTVVDVTALKQAQEAALQEKARFKLIFDGVPVGISYFAGLHEGTTTVALMNDAHLNICGLTREQAEDPEVFKRLSHPEDGARQAALEAQVNRGEISGFTLEKRYLRPDGRTVWVAFSTQKRQKPDGGFERLSTVVDITDLKLAQNEAARRENQLRFVFESMPYSITWIYYHPERIERMINKQFFQITGLDPHAVPELSDVRGLTHPEDLQRQDELRARIDAGVTDQLTMEKRYIRKDGTVVWVNLTIRVYRDPTGRILQEVSTLTDITERKQAEVDLARANSELVDASRRAGMAEVATGVLHNVGNVLNSVNVSCTLVADQVRRSKSVNVAKLSALLEAHASDLGTFLVDDPKGRLIPGYLNSLAISLAEEREGLTSELENLRKNIDHIKDIVAMQQSYARTSGVAEAVPVIELVEDAIRMNAGSLARHDIQIVREYELRPTLSLDKHKVLQILVNLIRNAKYACDEAERADKIVRLRVTAVPEGVAIAVIDNGIGIPAENLTRIFGHGFTTRQHGHGFGLHSGALAAQQIGGTLTAHSAGHGEGATFVLTLPLSREIL